MTLALTLGLISALLWVSLVVAHEDAPAYAWQLLWFPVLAVAVIGVSILIPVASLGRLHCLFKLEDR